MNAIQEYRQLRGEVDLASERLSALHKDSMQCGKGCCGCCQNLSVWPVEYYSILDEMVAAGIRPVLDDEKECSFLDEAGNCQIYPFRPMICRTHGLPLVYWHDEIEPPGWGVMFCEKNFTNADEIEFTPDNVINMDEVNEKLARLNVAFVEAHPDKNLTPETRIELRQLLSYLQRSD